MNDVVINDISEENIILSALINELSAIRDIKQGMIDKSYNKKINKYCFTEEELKQFLKIISKIEILKILIKKRCEMNK